MSLFDKMFGKKVSAEKGPDTPAPLQEADIITALLSHVRGDLEAALSAYLNIAEKTPDYTLAPFFAATIKSGMGNTAEAAETLRSLSQQFSSAGESISRGIAMELAELLQDRAVPRVPAVAEIVVSFGDLLKKEGFLRESAVCFEIGTGLAPDNAHMLHKLGDTLHDLRIYDYAESVLKEALRHAPHHWGAMYTYAVLLQDLGRNEEAVTYYERAVKLVPTHVSCQNNYGAALLRVNRLDEAFTHCTLAAELDPKAPLVKINLGYIYSLRQEFDAARACFTEAIALDDGLAPAYFGLAAVEQSLQGDPKRIRELYLKAIELAPSLTEAHYALGNLLTGEGNEEALSHFSSAARLNGNLRNLQRDFGIACLNFGRREEGLQHLRLALQQDPDDASLQAFLAKAETDNPE